MVGKPGRTWFPLDVTFTTDDKVLDAGERSAWLLLAMLGKVYAAQRPGVLTRREVGALGIAGWERRLPPLLKTGLVDETEPGVLLVPSWEGWQSVSERAAYMRDYRARQRDKP